MQQTATVTGTVITPGDVITTTINTIGIPYTVVAGDTVTSIAKNIGSQINSITVQDPFSGLPLNTIILATLPTPPSGVITIEAINSGVTFSLLCAFTPDETPSYLAGPYLPPRWTATVGGTNFQAGVDTFTTTINGTALTYTATANDTDANTLASSIAANINASIRIDPNTSLPLNSVVFAAPSGNVITLTAKDPTTPFTLQCFASSSAETYIAAGPLPARQTMDVAGTFAANRTLVTTINGIAIPYTTATNDGLGPIPIAEKIVDAINSSPLNSLVSAAAGPAVIFGGRTSRPLTITAKDTTSNFTLTVSLPSGGYTAGRKPSPFADDGYGNFLQDSSQTVFGHEAALCAACNLTGTEFGLIAEALGFDFNSHLKLDNVSAIFRFGWLAHTLGVSVQEFLLLRKFSGLDPFAPLDPGTPPPAEPPAVRFIRLLHALSAAGLRPVQALYLIWNQDISGKSAPPSTDITGLARALRADFAAVEAQFALVTDPDGSVAKGLMALVYGSAATDFFFGLLNNTLATSVAYAHPQPTLAQSIVDASGGRLSYDDLPKQLTFAGVLDSGTQMAINQAIELSLNLGDGRGQAAAA